ncbi:MAG TPA: ribosome silencing factor [Pyrinomonadaceae bacterium]|jgi:ribosome-associated protein
MEQNTSIKEKVLHPEQSGKNQAANPRPSEAAGDKCAQELDARLCTALRAANDKKALEMVVLDLREIASFTDYFLIASGTNVRQVQAISDEIAERLKKQGTPAERIEGYKSAEWILLDYGDFLVHVFEDKSRKFYDLERLWRDARRLEINAALLDQPDAGSLRNSQS